MPFINSKISVKLDEEKEKAIKQRLGQAIRIFPGKSETYLMVGFEEDYNLYFQGKKCEKAAFVEVRLFGNADSRACEQMTAEISRIYEEELGIPPANLYISYQPVANWGWNGANL